MLPVELFHAGILGFLFELGFASPQLLFARILGNTQFIQIMLTISIDVRLIQLQLMAGIIENDLLAAGKDFMTAVLLIPLGERCGQCIFSMILRQPTPVL